MRLEAAVLGCPHSMPPLMMLIVSPNPGSLPSATSVLLGVQLPTITSWHEGSVADAAVVQNQSAVLNASVGSFAT